MDSIVMYRTYTLKGARNIFLREFNFIERTKFITTANVMNVTKAIQSNNNDFLTVKRLVL